MGISRGGARLLIEEAKNRPFSGRVLQLGRQYLFFGQTEMDQLARLHSVELQRAIPPGNIFEPMLDPSYLDDGSFFSELGFSEVESIDYSTNENPTYVHDLNREVPDALKNRFDLIYDGGAIEHIFDVRSVLHNIFDMLRVGGRVIHTSPSSNHVDHGFYMFSPTLFLDYYSSNNFIIHEILIVLYSVAHNTEPWSIHEYEPGCLDGLSFGGFDKGKLVAIFVSAEKTADSTWDRIPQQGSYARIWKDHQADVGHPHIARKSKLARLPPSRRRTLLDILLRRETNPVPNKIAEY